MSSKIKRKKKSLEEKEAAKAELRERNRQLSDQLSAMPRTGSSMLERFTKWRMITYVCVICLPPYGLYRIWSKESTFVLPERVVWTFIIIVYVLQLAKFFLIS